MDTLDSVEVNLNTRFVLCLHFEHLKKTITKKKNRPIVVGILFFQGSAIFLDITAGCSNSG